MKVVPLAFGFPSVDAHDQVTALVEVFHEVFGVTGNIFPAQKDMFFLNGMVATGFFQVLGELLDPGRRVGNRKRFLEDVAQAVTEENAMLALGKVQGSTENFLAVARVLEQAVKLWIVIGVDAIFALHCRPFISWFSAIDCGISKKGRRLASQVYPTWLVIFLAAGTKFSL